MKFSLIAAATVALAGLASANGIQTDEHCRTFVTAEVAQSCVEFAEANGASLLTFKNINSGLPSDCVVEQGQKYCVSVGRTHAKRCLAEKKKAEEKKKQEQEQQKEEEEPKQEEKPAKKPSGNAPSEYAIPRSETSGLRLVNKINENCQWYYTILPEDDGCYAVAEKNNIPVETLYKLNKNLHSKEPNVCDNLDTGKTYCIGL
ncbi:predicted protein [Lichtheimia corymbifera JMRC:FSU:9682]|uniref:LysM domain-containing protein n=1 Tax=Lichtheimia corymbifera JMRC:FSU:9682 TaxID=1263082 RepID=A0A068RQ65_9FUNG|nr:predicted protein [Lichtheimia corymbifera JMRC:FSU:9682]